MAADKKNVAIKSRVPVIEQMHQYECGICCLNMILSYYNFEINLAELRQYFGNGRDGVSLLRIKQVAEKFHMDCQGKRIPIDLLTKETIPFPVIAFYEDKHYVVLEKVTRGKFFIVDPAVGRIKVSREEFGSKYSGVILIIKPSDNFQPRKKKSQLGLKEIICNYKSSLLYLLAFSLLIQLISVGIPMLIKTSIDMIIVRGNHRIIIHFVLFFLILSILQVILSLSRGYLLIKMQNRLDYDFMDRFVSHLLRLPYKFFELRSRGDLILRANSNIRIRDFLSQQLITSLINICLVFVLFVYMIIESKLLAAVVVIIGIIQVMTITLTKSKLKYLTKSQITSQTIASSFMTEILNGVSTVKSLGIEDKVYETWEKLLRRQVQANKDKAYFQLKVDTITSTLYFMTPLVVMCVGIYQIIEGSITIGTLFAFQSVTLSFLTPLNSLAMLINDLVTIETLLDRINDVLGEEKEIDEDDDNKELCKLKGDITLKNVSFRYNKYGGYNLKNISLSIKSGQKVAIVGKSGSGKSTLAALLAGLYTPTSGQIFFDGYRQDEISKKFLRKNIGVVLQENFLFNKTILDNLTIHNPNVSMDDVLLATKRAQIHEDIEAMPMGYQTIISEGGSNLSGGQRQRLALARALIGKPSILLLDEATSALDTVTEKKIDDAIQKLNCTRIVIAHRISTIINSDLIVVLSEGSIVDIGTHQQLLSRCDYYRELYYSNFMNECNEKDAL